jgi:hypothetical protein
MFVGSGPHSPGIRLSPRAVSIHAFPGSRFSYFSDAFTVVFFEHDLSLPLNEAVQSILHPDRGCSWYGNVLFIKHAGHNLQRYRSLAYEDKSLADAILSRYV